MICWTWELAAENTAASFYPVCYLEIIVSTRKSSLTACWETIITELKAVKGDSLRKEVYDLLVSDASVNFIVKCGKRVMDHA